MDPIEPSSQAGSKDLISSYYIVSRRERRAIHDPRGVLIRTQLPPSFWYYVQQEMMMSDGDGYHTMSGATQSA